MWKRKIIITERNERNFKVKRENYNWKKQQINKKTKERCRNKSKKKEGHTILSTLNKNKISVAIISTCVLLASCEVPRVFLPSLSSSLPQVKNINHGDSGGRKTPGNKISHSRNRICINFHMNLLTLRKPLDLFRPSHRRKKVNIHGEAEQQKKKNKQLFLW